MPKIHFTSDDPDWAEWWVNPVKDGSSDPDPVDLQETKKYIERTYTPETQQIITIKVRSQREE
ncbi:MAG: hypothetical protein V7K64_19410 [Nostoc sp.]|uniref:hypothetical protein n=1 Tax=Nostoc sp. TaxID=1180 RepID=UPI002FF67E37